MFLFVVRLLCLSSILIDMNYRKLRFLIEQAVKHSMEDLIGHVAGIPKKPEADPAYGDREKDPFKGPGSPRHEPDKEYSDDVYVDFLEQVTIAYARLAARHRKGKKDATRDLNRLMNALERPLEGGNAEFLYNSFLNKKPFNQAEELVQARDKFFLKRLRNLKDDFLNTKAAKYYGAPPPIKEGKYWRFPKLLY